MRKFCVMAIMVLPLFFFGAGGHTDLPASATVSVTFAVRCYDVGAAALEGRPGILLIGKGWKDFGEVNRVAYDPDQVTVEQMEQWLQESGTYIRTVEKPAGSRDRQTVRE